MHVNSAFKAFFNNRLVVASGIAGVILAVFLIATSFTKPSDHDLREKQTNLLIREIGHRLLLQAGDSTSRVLPVTEIKEGTFVLQFENEFAFSHDSLMELSKGLLNNAQFPFGYTVTVSEGVKAGIVYGFQVNNTASDILACSGRIEPLGCYLIEFAFPDFYGKPFDYPFIGLVSSMLLLSTVALLIGRFGKSSVPMPVNNQDCAVLKDSDSELVALGKFSFDVKNQRLLPAIGTGSEVISLTDKECKILELLSANFGELTSRETLMQVWVNEGVITGRSLDMFVSKLRRKLSSDPALRITNVHGKGYKLEIPGRQIL